MLDLVLVLHVLGAIVGFGPAIVVPPILGAAAAGGDLPPAQMFAVYRRMQPLLKAIDVIQPLTGAWLILITKDRWDPFAARNRWLLVSIVLYTALMAFLYGVMMPTMNSAMAAVERGDPTAFTAVMERMKRVGPIPPLVLLTIAVLMMVKPGSGFSHP